jgi:hypothetical protein
MQTVPECMGTGSGVSHICMVPIHEEERKGKRRPRLHSLRNSPIRAPNCPNMNRILGVWPQPYRSFIRFCTVRANSTRSFPSLLWICPIKSIFMMVACFQSMWLVRVLIAMAMGGKIPFRDIELNHPVTSLNRPIGECF